MCRSRFPGSNCDVDLYKAILQIKGATAEYVWHTDTDLDRFDVLLIPGDLLMVIT